MKITVGLFKIRLRLNIDVYNHKINPNKHFFYLIKTLLFAVVRMKQNQDAGFRCVCGAGVSISMLHLLRYMNRLDSDASEFNTRKDTDEQRYVPRLIIRRTGHIYFQTFETFREVAGENSDLPRQKNNQTMNLSIQATKNVHIQAYHMNEVFTNCMYYFYTAYEFIAFILLKTQK